MSVTEHEFLKSKWKTVCLSSSTGNKIVSSALQAASSVVDNMGRVRCTLLKLHNRLVSSCDHGKRGDSTVQEGY